MNLTGFSAVHVIGILISEGNISTDFNLNDFMSTFESEYEDVLINWRGFFAIFDRKWIVTKLLDSLDYYNNLPFVVSSLKPEKKQHRKIVRFLKILGDGQGRFLIRKVLGGLQKFLNMSEAYVLDLLMMMKRDDVISFASIDYILKSEEEDQMLVETHSSGVIVEDSIDVASDTPVDFIDKEETNDTERIEPQEFEEISTGAQQGTVSVGEDGRYSFESELSLDVLIKNAVELWLRNIIADAVENELGRRVDVYKPEYVPIGYDSEKGTIRIRVTFFDAKQSMIND